ncbi:MAG TPA: putative glycoside hydrolase [Candidatus Avimonas sp.]|nr:putative glycoside hydrolase [Candidatus Avimonas sp.]HQD38552.1 putative glycoside hydrolase [Candidatus Avimonas sp.]
MSYRKGRKIRRRGPSVFSRSGRRKAMLKKIGTYLLALLLIPAGFFSAKFILENFRKPAPPSSSTVSTITTSAPTSTTNPPPADPADSGGTLRAIYIPISKLANPETVDTLLNSASSAGFNAVVFDLKSADGVLHYQSSTPFAQQAKAADQNALTADQLKSLINRLKGKGFAAIPRVFAFRDPLSPRNLPTAKITLEKYPTYTWLDNSKEKGGKPWLNPYAPDAHSYIRGIVLELEQTGFSTIMLDGVQFPDQTSQAYYGTSELTSLSKLNVLKKFVGDIKSLLKENTRLILTMPGLSAFGTKTEQFGGNPVTLGADIAAPVLMPSTLGSRLKAGDNLLVNPALVPYDAVKLAAGQISLRLELMPESERPALMPWLQSYDYSVSQIEEQINAATETLGDDASYILYNPDGNYRFSQ